MKKHIPKEAIDKLFEPSMASSNPGVTMMPKSSNKKQRSQTTDSKPKGYSSDETAQNQKGYVEKNQNKETEVKT